MPVVPSRHLSLVVVVATLLPGCADSRLYVSPNLYVRANLTDRMQPTTPIGVITLDVRVHRFVEGRHQLDPEWSAVARTNIDRALERHFGHDPRFRIVTPGLAWPEEAKREFEAARASLETLVPAYINSGSTISIRPVPALGEAATADVLLFVYATDHVMPVWFKGVVALVAVPAVLLSPSSVVPAVVNLWPPHHAEPALRDMTAVATCLVDAHTGNVLAFSVHRFIRRDLRKPGGADALIHAVRKELD